MLSILYALVPMITWGSIGLVGNRIGGRPNQQTLGHDLWSSAIFSSGMVGS